MTTQEWQRVEELLTAALGLDPIARRKFLDEASAGQPELRREVESLIECEEQAKGFLATPALEIAADLFGEPNAPELLAGRPVGHYRIIREIGRGGMGAVYLAERADGAFEQQVALKIVQSSFIDSELARRFRRERQILASLNHPNIARLLDGGVSQAGEPFLAMEFVKGARIDDYCDERRLTVDERLRLFLIVCQAVSYAHQHLIVHRDIKPSNILVTEDGSPKLLDFGIAKLLDAEHAAEQTRTEMRAFTPEYASPEQIKGEQITTASDVYSLGVLLEELLVEASEKKTVAPLFEQTTAPEQAAATDLPAPVTKESQRATVKSRKPLSGELRRIIEMARREEMARRYASVAQLAEDVQRHLDGLPVRAQKDSFTYRAGKFVLRNKVAVGAAALVLLSLIVGLALALWQAGVARHERDRAERRFADVRQLSNALLTDIAPKIERLQGSVEARQALVVQSLKYLDRLAQESGNDMGLQAELAAAYEKVAELQGSPSRPNLGDFAGAISSYEKANRMRRNLPPNRGNQLLLAENFRGLANVRYTQNDIEGTLQDFAAAMKIQEDLLTQEPNSYDLQMAHLKTRYEIAETYAYNNQYDVAVPRLREIVAALERLDPNRLETRLLLAKAYSQLGNSLSWDDKQSEAEIEMAKAVAIADRLTDENSNDTDIQHNAYRVYAIASNIYENVNDEIALQLAQKGLRIAEQAVERDAADVRAKQNLARMYSRVGNIFANLRRIPEAIANLEKSERAFLELLERDPANRSYRHLLGIHYTHFGDAKQKQGDMQGALKAFQKSVDYFELASQADEKNLLDRRNLAQSLKSVGFIYLKLGDKQKAKENYQRALDLLNQLKAQNALGNWDNKLFDEVRDALRLIG